MEVTITGITGDNKVYDGTTAATATGTAILSGIIGADDVFLGGSPVFTFASANVGTGITINTTGYTISGTDSGNYTLTQPVLSADITPVSAEFISVSSDGDESVSSVVIPVNIPVAYTTVTATVDYIVTGTATSGEDYTLTDGTLIFSPGSTSEDITIASIIDDTIVETDEIVIITLSNPTNLILGTNTVYTYIINNNDSTEVTINSDIDVDEDSGFATLTATLSNPLQGGFFIHVTTADGTAVAPGDYTAFNDDPNTYFTGTAGETQNILIPIIDDSQGELNETFTVSLSSVSGTTLEAFIITTDSAMVTIIDNDPPVVTDVTVPVDGLYGIGDDLDFTVTFTDFITTTGIPVIPITIGSETVNAELLAAVDNSLTATFRYTIVEGNNDLDGIEVGTDINLNGGTIIGTNSTLDAILTLNAMASTGAVNVEGIRPIPTITSSVPDPTNASFDMTIVFDEPVTGLTLAGIDIGNGAVSNLIAVSTTEYTVTISPLTDGIVTVSILADAAFDTAGNGNVVSNQFSVDYDITRPVPTILSTTPDPTNTTFDVTINFTEDVTGFELADIAVVNGTAANFVAVSASQYSAMITPTTDGIVTVELAASVVMDLADNGNNASNVFSVLYDATNPIPPTILGISDYSCSGIETLTGDNTLEIFGTAENSSTVEIFIEGVSVGSVISDADTGFYLFDYTDTILIDGVYTIVTQATDAATNTSELSEPFSITINTIDSDSDGIADFCDDDDDGNGVLDVDEDCDGDGIINSQDTDFSSCASVIRNVTRYGFSPNADGINDVWTIEEINAYPNSIVRVFNRSGKLVFEKRGYQNDWNGLSNQLSGNGLGNKLPVGPYIFMIDLGDGKEYIKGWLYINY